MGKPIRPSLRSLLTSRWTAPAAAGIAFAAALATGRLIEGPRFPEDHWPRRLTVIEREIASADQPDFLARLCSEGQERGYRCSVGKGKDSLVPVHYVELWERDVHITALAVIPSATVEIQLFDNVDRPATAEADWVRSL